MTKNEFFKQLKNIKVVALDLDGTIYLGENLIEGAKQALEIFRKNGIKIVYLTNNSSKTENEYIKKLSRMGVFEKDDCILTSTKATADYILSNNINNGAYILATDEVKNEFRQYGVYVDEDNAKIAVLAYDKTLTYDKIVRFNRLICSGAKYLATHGDLVCPSENVYLPDVGSFIKMFEQSSKRLPNQIVGKPNVFMGEKLCKDYSVSASQVMMVGDRLYTDIRFGVNCGFLTALVLSGETSVNDLKASTDKPDCIFKNVLEIANLLKF